MDDKNTFIQRLFSDKNTKIIVYVVSTLILISTILLIGTVVFTGDDIIVDQDSVSISENNTHVDIHFTDINDVSSIEIISPTGDVIKTLDNNNNLYSMEKIAYEEGEYSIRDSETDEEYSKFTISENIVEEENLNINVQNTQQDPIEDAIIEINNNEYQTDESGSIEISDLETQEYVVKVSADNYNSQEITIDLSNEDNVVFTLIESS